MTHRSARPPPSLLWKKGKGTLGRESRLFLPLCSGQLPLRYPSSSGYVICATKTPTGVRDPPHAVCVENVVMAKDLVIVKNVATIVMSVVMSVMSVVMSVMPTRIESHHAHKHSACMINCNLNSLFVLLSICDCLRPFIPRQRRPFLLALHSLRRCNDDVLPSLPPLLYPPHLLPRRLSSTVFA